MIYLLLFFIFTLLFSFISANSVEINVSILDYTIETNSSFVMISFLITVMIIYILFEIFLIPKKISVSRKKVESLIVNSFNANISFKLGFMEKFQQSFKILTSNLNRDSILNKILRIEKQILLDSSKISEDSLIEIMENNETRFIGSYHLINLLQKRENNLVTKDVLNKIKKSYPDFYNHLLPVKLKILLREKEWLKSIECLNLIIEKNIQTNFNSKRQLAIVYYIIANEIFEIDGDLDKSILYLNKSLSIKENILGVITRYADLVKLKSGKEESLNILRKYYAVMPHKDVISKYYEIYECSVEGFLHVTEEIVRINENKHVYDIAAKIAIDFAMYRQAKDFLEKSISFGENSQISQHSQNYT